MRAEGRLATLIADAAIMPTASQDDLYQTVLLVDPDADTRDMYELAFTLEGFRTAASASAFEGFAAAQDLAPALIVADVGPPGRTQAFEMLAWLRADEQTRNIPVVALNGYELSADTDWRSFERILLKPVAPDTLVASARAALRRSRELRERAGRLRATVPAVLQRSHRALARSAQVTQRHAVKLRCPRCRAFLTSSFVRVGGGRARQYRPCANGCGVFYFDPVSGRMMPLST